MPLYRCSICGENFPGKLLDQDELVGFYTTRYIEADSSEQAELAVLELLRNDSSLDLAAEYRSHDAKVYFEEIEEVPTDSDQMPQAGFAFFTMGT